MEASEKSSRSGFGFSDVFFCAILTLLRERVVVVVVVDGWMDGWRIRFHSYRCFCGLSSLVVLYLGRKLLFAYAMD